jgi:hypothetical protein
MHIVQDLAAVWHCSICAAVRQVGLHAVHTWSSQSEQEPGPIPHCSQHNLRASSVGTQQLRKPQQPYQHHKLADLTLGDASLWVSYIIQDAQNSKAWQVREPFMSLTATCGSTCLFCA